MLDPYAHPAKVWGKALRAQQGQTWLQFEKVLSRRMHIHLVRIDTLLISEDEAIRQLYQWNEIIYAQKNHYLSHRSIMSTVPNDPMFNMQWSLENTGQSAGVPDADIDATDAWDISTGGITALGDTIVVAVIDKGVDLNHQELSLWKNLAEIPNDGIDNDLNGYVDDYHGWNANEESDSIPSSDPHGTQVSGIVAANGNDSTGISGVNWYTQIMPIVNFLKVESELVQCYEYALNMRKRYNQTGGTDGAFVVATNSSFGVDLAKPADYPIWCAVFDSLGAEGILNIAATANVGNDIDVVGDMPTACGSDWLITVTNTNRFDELSGGSGFGATTIDLGAPGTQILSTLPGNNYGSQSGTSFAAPHVSGAVALLFSSACSNIMNQYKLTPAAMALEFKNWILEGVDSLPSLQGKTVTGGRLNIANSVFDQLADCGNYNPDCPSPYNFEVSQRTDTSAVLAWAEIDSAISYTLRYRQQSDTSWAIVQLDSNRYHLGGLMPCTSYEFQVSALCNADNSGFLATRSFTTEACCESPRAAKLIQFTDSSAHFNWRPVFGAQYYLLLHKASIAAQWDTTMVTDTSLVLPLLPCTEYLWKLGTVCDTMIPQFTEPQTFFTLGCGFCQDQPYCTSEGEKVQFEWIDSVGLGAIQNKSGPNNGYNSFFDTSYVFVADSAYDLYLIPGYQTFNSAEYWRIWVDLNQDGEFSNDSTELLLDLTDGLVGPLQTTLSFPAANIEGSTRMRISMKFEGINGDLPPPGPCENFEFGEVEDYCIWIDGTVGLDKGLKDQTVKVYPNPFGDKLRIEAEYGLERIQIYNMMGQILIDQSVDGQDLLLPTSQLLPGIYLVSVKTSKGYYQERILKR